MFISIHFVIFLCCRSASLFVCLFIWCWRFLAGRLEACLLDASLFYSLPLACMAMRCVTQRTVVPMPPTHTTPIEPSFTKYAAAVAARVFFIRYHKQTVFESLRHICYINAPRWVNNNNLMTDTLSKRQTSCNINKLCAHANCNRGGMYQMRVQKCECECCRLLLSPSHSHFSPSHTVSLRRVSERERKNVYIHIMYILHNSTTDLWISLNLNENYVFMTHLNEYKKKL